MRSKSVLYYQLRLLLWNLQTLVPINPFPQYKDPDDPDWILTQELVKAIHKISKSHNSIFLLVLLPQRNYLNGKFDPSIYDKIESFAAHENITNINLFTRMKDYPWTDIFYPEDGHFTPMGAQVAAKEISKKIQTMYLP